MTIADAIKWLKKIQEKHGGDIEIYFDCPECKQAFTPTTVVATVMARVEAKS